MASSTSETLQNIKIHKVPNFDVWKGQYEQTDGIGADDLVIIPPTSLENTIKDWIPNPEGTNTPLMNGTASTGSATTWSKSDHVHPTDTNKQNKIMTNGILKGNGSGTITAAVLGTDYADPTLLKYAVVTAGTTSGTAPNFTLTSTTVSSYNDGETIRFKLHTDSGDNPTINVNSLGAVPLKTPSGKAAKNILANVWLAATYCRNATTPSESFFVLMSNSEGGVNYYTGSTTPTNNLGSDGDIYVII